MIALPSRDLVAVIRYSGERTFDTCKSLVLRQMPEEQVHVVNERPFEAALRQCYQIGITSRAKWMLTLDADVLLRDGSVAQFLTYAERLPMRYLQIEGRVHDKLTGLYRNAGHRIYRVQHLPIALAEVPSDRATIRPELSTLEAMERLGYPSFMIRSVFGIHDYEQYYRDIYRKAFVHANKHAIWLPQIVERWKGLASEDDDFRIALRGLYDGLMSTAGAAIDSRECVAEAERALNELGIHEKSPLQQQAITFAGIESVLSQTGNPDSDRRPEPLKRKLQRLRSRHVRLGALRLMVYLLGAFLTDVGSKIKQLSALELDSR